MLLRSLFSPDPNIETSEIGIPPVFALKLTYPEPVTQYNLAKLRQAVINGPLKWPGATHVQHEDGKLTVLANLSEESRAALQHQLLIPQESAESLGKGVGVYSTHTVATNKKVYRHLENGDYLLVNRQPTLHKPSIMAHRAKILPGEKTIRMHYANCNTYNADFDGDEMNVHFPQNEIARAEAMLIANTDNQYLVPTNGGPLRGLIQDHIVVGVLLTAKDTFLTREDYHQLVYGSLRADVPGAPKLELVPPTVFKPVPLWSGKQVITTILKNLTRNLPSLNNLAKSKVPGKYWDGYTEEGEAIFVDGHLVCGVLDKSSFGASAYGMVHSCFEVYGPTITGDLLSILGRLFTKYVQMIGFTCRMDDLRLHQEGDAWRRDLLVAGAGAGRETSLEYVGLEKDSKNTDGELRHRLEEVLRDDEKLAGLDAAMKSQTNSLTSSIISKCLPNGLLKKFPENNMQTMTVSGAKGSSVNVSQISCCLGQQELEGRRVPTMISGKTLPSFVPFDTSARAGGFIGGRFLTGIRPQEYFFHCMAGREGLIDTAVKTSRSGYLQRCLIKHLEGLKVAYDHTVRDSDGSILQFHYGEDSLDVTKQKHLYQFDFSASNYAAFVEKYRPWDAIDKIEDGLAEKYMRKALYKPKKYDPVLSRLSPGRHLGAVSEKYEQALNEYIDANPSRYLSSKEKPNRRQSAAVSKAKFRSLMYIKYMHSLAAPGESVGLLAAQSVGEPSTQMTLNTFHFAGFGAKNVTLGIPRLREIIMTASPNIKTPTMILPLQPHATDEDAKTLCKELSRLRLAHLVDKLSITESVQQQDGGSSNVRVYAARIQLFDAVDYFDEYAVRPKDIEAALLPLISQIDTRIRKTLSLRKGQDEAVDIAKPSTLSSVVDTEAVEDDDDNEPRKSRRNDDDDDAAGDGDAFEERERSAKKETATYDAPDADDNDIIDTINRAEDSDDEEAVEMYESPEYCEDTESKPSGRFVKYCHLTDNGSVIALRVELAIDVRSLLFTSLLEECCKATTVRQCPGIEWCFPVVNESRGRRVEITVD